MNAAKSQLDIIKEKSDNKDICKAKKLMFHARNTIENNLIELKATKQQRDDLITQLEEAKKGKFLNVYGILYCTINYNYNYVQYYLYNYWVY